MGVEPNWAILGNVPNIGASFQTGLLQGQEQADKFGMRNALNAYFQNPTDPRAMAYIGSRNPEMALNLQSRALAQSDRVMTRNAIGNLIGDDGTVADPGSTSKKRAPNAMVPTGPGASSAGNALAPPAPLAAPGASPPPSGGGPKAPASMGAASADDAEGDGSDATKPPAGGAAPLPLAPIPGVDPQVNARRLTAWRTLAQVNPDLFFKLRKMSSEEQDGVRKDLEWQLDMGSRAFNAVNAAAPADRPAVYASVKSQLEDNGVEGLPDQWTPQTAAQLASRIKMGMHAKDALTLDRQAADTASQIQRRTDETAIGRDRNAIDERNNIRTTSTSRANNQDSNATSRDNNVRSTTVSRENNVRTTTQSNTNNARTTGTSAANNARTTAVSAGRGRGRLGGGAAAVAKMPDGTPIVVRNGKWVNANTGAPVQ